MPGSMAASKFPSDIAPVQLRQRREVDDFPRVLFLSNETDKACETKVPESQSTAGDRKGQWDAAASLVRKRCCGEAPPLELLRRCYSWFAATEFVFPHWASLGSSVEQNRPTDQPSSSTPPK